MEALATVALLQMVTAPQSNTIKLTILVIRP
jgi:hypothetical protein